MYSLNSILQKEINNRNQIFLHLESGCWKAYEASARKLSVLLGHRPCQREVFQGRQLDTFSISPEILTEETLVNYCSVVDDNIVVLKLM